MLKHAIWLLALAGMVMSQDENTLASKPPSHWPPLLAVFGVLMLGTIIILGASALRPELDLLLLIGAVSVLLSPTLIAVLNLLKTKETHDLVNSQSQLVKKLEQRIHFAEGLAEGRGPVEPAAPATPTVLPVVIMQQPPPATVTIQNGPAPETPGLGSPLHSGDKVNVKKEP